MTLLTLLQSQGAPPVPPVLLDGDVAAFRRRQRKLDQVARRRQSERDEDSAELRRLLDAAAEPPEPVKVAPAPIARAKVETPSAAPVTQAEPVPAPVETFPSLAMLAAFAADSVAMAAALEIDEEEALMLVLA